MLEVEGIHTYYGLSHILFGVSLKVDPRVIVCLLGRNGAGKTTTLRSVIGLNPPREGRVRFKGEDVTGMEPYLLTRKGVSYVPDQPGRSVPRGRKGRGYDENPQVLRSGRIGTSQGKPSRTVLTSGTPVPSVLDP